LAFAFELPLPPWLTTMAMIAMTMAATTPATILMTRRLATLVAIVPAAFPKFPPPPGE
jgi:hypothetical protein